MKKHIFISLLIFLGLISCKQPPTFSSTNPNDPNSEGFIPPSPQETDIEIRNLNTNYYEIQLLWKMPKELRSGVSGYHIYKSNISYDEVRLLLGPEIIEWQHNIYFYEEQFFPDGSTDYYFKIESYFIQGSDTVYSNPVFTSLVDWEYFCHFCP